MQKEKYLTDSISHDRKQRIEGEHAVCNISKYTSTTVHFPFICFQQLKHRHAELQKSQQTIVTEQNDLARRLDDVKARKVKRYSFQKTKD